MKKCILLVCIIFLCCSIQAEEKKGFSKNTKKAVKKAIDKGVRFLRNSQTKDGHWEFPGITALALAAFFNCPRKYSPADGPWVRKPLEYLLSLQKKDGGIYISQAANYNTCVAIMALTSNAQVAKEHQNAIKKARDFLIKLQCDEGEGYTPGKDVFYGGIGYGGDERPDLSNMQYALEALKASGLKKDHPAFKKAIVFLQRCQNRSESNDQKWSSNDNGFVYYPGNSPAGKIKLPDGRMGYRSYGSMTYAGIKSYIYAGLDKNDPRVKAAYGWIQKNYDLSQNPGAGKQGLYYYYHTFAKTMLIWGENAFVDSKGVSHNWREDLAQVLLHTQRKDGSWINKNDRWWESDPRLVTSYVILALSMCYDS